MRPSPPFFLFLVGSAALLSTGGARADEPLEIPTSRTIIARGARCWAYTDAATKETTAYRRGKLKGKPIKLWSIDGWYRVAALATDCEHFVTGYDGGNLLPEGYARDTVMLAFYRKGVLIRRVTLAELIKDLSKLEKTVSHWSWGCYVGVEKGTLYRVGTVDRGELVFDMKTGLPFSPIVRPTPLRPAGGDKGDGKAADHRSDHDKQRARSLPSQPPPR